MNAGLQALELIKLSLINPDLSAASSPFQFLAQ